jgi:hypothetical protein
MGSLSRATRKTIKDEPTFKKRLNHVHEGLVHHSIFYRCFMDATLFWVKDRERPIGIVSITARPQLIAQVEKIIFKLTFELNNIRSRMLACTKTTPCVKQVLKRADSLK